jgi:hypothetical protein
VQNLARWLEQSLLPVLEPPPPPFYKSLILNDFIDSLGKPADL